MIKANAEKFSTLQDKYWLDQIMFVSALPTLEALSVVSAVINALVEAYKICRLKPPKRAK